MAVAALDFTLQLADDNLVVAQRLGELIASMPDLEEDIAVANLALDHLGQARNFYAYAATLDGAGAGDGGAGRGEDDFAMLRSEREFLNSVLVEQPNGDFAHTTVRQFFVDAFQVPLYGALAASADDQIAAVAAKAVKEARYHLDHSAGWLVILGDGTDESHRRAQGAIDALWQFTADQFTVLDNETLVGDGVVPAEAAATVRAAFDASVATTLADAQLELPDDPYQRLGGRTGFHTSHLGHLLPEMQWLYRAHPGAQW